MSNHKMQFPSHISKSWLSVCIFIFLLTVCVGLAIHVTSEEDAICSDSDHSEVPIVSNENVSEKSGSDIEYAKNYVPTEEDVLAARQQATEGMSQQQIENLTEVVKTANLWLEHKYIVADGLFCREIDGLFCRSSPDIIVRRRCVLSHKRRGWLQPSPSFRYSRNLALQDELYHPVINNGPAVLVCVDKRLGTGPVNQSRDAG